MSNRTKLQWQVPSEEWDRFRQFVDSEYGNVKGYLSREVENAMREYALTDGYEKVEQLVDRLVQAAGRTLGDRHEEKRNLYNGETSRVTVNVDTLVKDSFCRQADDDTGSYGRVLAKALRAYREGGRAGRIKDKLERVVDDAEAILSVAGDSESESTSNVEKKTIAIASNLGDEFTNDDLNETIHDIAGRGERASDPTLEKYRKRVTNHADVEPHPSNSKLWIPSEKAERLASGTPRECRVPAEVLDRDDRIKRIKLAVGRRAATRNSGRASISATDILEHVLDNEVSRSTLTDLLREIELIDGYRVDRSSSGTSLRIVLSTVGESDEELFNEIIEYRDESDRGLLSSANAKADRGPSAGRVEMQQERLTQAQAVTDGGSVDKGPQ